MNRHFTTPALSLLVSIFFLGMSAVGCGEKDENTHDPAKSESEDLDGFWGVDDDVESQFVYLDEEEKDGKIQVEVDESTLTIRDDSHILTAMRSPGGQSYVVEGEYGDVFISCSILYSLQLVEMSCELNGTPCRYTLGAVDGGYEPQTDECSAIYSTAAEETKKALSKSLSEKTSRVEKSSQGDVEKPWDHECHQYDDVEPDICPNVVMRDGIKYFFRNSCNDTPLPVTASDGRATDHTEVLRILRAYSENEREGCFLFGCNGPHGNFHFVVMPYNKKLLEGPRLDIARKIRDAENVAPLSVHTLLPGAYAKGDQCEWYETDAVGYQDVYYDNKVIWDWDTFCLGDKCPYKLIFAVYESDEESRYGLGFIKLDDFVGYGVIQKGHTLDHDERFYAPQFKMAFRTGNRAPPSGAEFSEEATEIAFHEVAPFGLKFHEGIQSVKKLLADPHDTNVIWVSVFDSGSFRFPADRLIRWNHRGTLWDSSDDIRDDYTSYLTDGDSDPDDTTLEDMASDGNGGIWFVTSSHGITHFENSGQWVRYNNGISADAALSVDVGLDGKVYKGNTYSVDVFDGIEWRRIVRNSLTVEAVAVASDGKLWFGPYNDGVYSVDTDGIVQKQDFFWEEGLNEGWLLSMLIESPERIWFGTDTDGLYVWDTKNNSTQHIDIPFNDRGFGAWWIDDIHLDAHGRLWLATFSGVAYIDRDFNSHTFGSSVPSNGIETIVEDQLGRLFFGSAHGLYFMVEKPAP